MKKPMTEFERWTYRGLIALLLVMIWWGFQSFANKVDDNFKELINSTQELSRSFSTQNEAIKNLNGRVDLHEVRLNDHGTRLRGVEIKVR